VVLREKILEEIRCKVNYLQAILPFMEECKKRCTQLQILGPNSSVHEGKVFPERDVPSKTSPGIFPEKELISGSQKSLSSE